jgi:hypothetical protein
MKNETYFDHPTEPILKCEEEGCAGTMMRKTRNISFQSRGKTITIPDSEYWECDTCEAMVTTQKEINRLRKEATEPTERSGRLVLRMPPELHQRLVELASQHHRSLNGEILERLQESVLDKS